jgi:dihydrolipoamide dehydrogenase
MTDAPYDLVVIGAGPGGYVAAIRAAQLGLRVACVEKRATLGGTCLNVGCIPSKAMLQSSHLYEEAAHRFAGHGIKVNGLGLDLAAMLKRKEGVVRDNVQGVAFLFKKNKVDHVQGMATLTAADTVEVTPVNGGEARTLKSENILIATGSDVARLPGIDVDEKRIVSSTGALELTKVPETMVVIGGGYIGIELGSVWRRLGAKVTVVEFLDQILAGMDAEVSKQMLRILKKQGLEFRLGSKVTSAEKTNAGVSLTIEPAAGGEAEKMDVEVVLVSVGRRPYTEGLGLEAVGVVTDERGFIKVDHQFQTSIAGIFAIGDVIGGKMLAHKAEDEGIAVAELIAGQPGHVNYEAIPGVVYTWPEVAAVGRTEEQLRAEGIAIRTGRFPFTANARARCTGDTDGFVKIIADARTDRILGAHIVGAAAGDLIQEAVALIEFGGSAEDLARICHGHPGLSEAVKEAALAVAGRAIHI